MFKISLKLQCNWLHLVESKHCSMSLERTVSCIESTKNLLMIFPFMKFFHYSWWTINHCTVKFSPKCGNRKCILNISKQLIAVLMKTLELIEESICESDLHKTKMLRSSKVLDSLVPAII